MISPMDPDGRGNVDLRDPATTFQASRATASRFGLDYWLTPQWRIGGDVIAVSNQFFRGDAGNVDGGR
jgi:iron complex outermembrane recepter protein